MPGLAARLAGLSHAMGYLEHASARNIISLYTMKLALELSVCLSNHALAALNMMGADPEIETAKYVWSWIKSNGADPFSIRDCHRALRGRYHRVGPIKIALTILEECSYVVQQKIEYKGPGRSPSLTYIIPPKVM